MFNNIIKSPKITTGGGRQDNKKRILAAAIVCCLSFSAQSVYAEDSKIEFPSVPKKLDEGTLDYFHNNGVKIPETEEVYPESSYTLTETTDIDPENIPDGIVTKYEKQSVTKYFDPVSGKEVDKNDLKEGVNYREVQLFELVPKYYELGYKKDVYGEGEDVNYFKWTKNPTTNNITFDSTDLKSEAQITVNYNKGNNVRIVTEGGIYDNHNINQSLNNLYKLNNRGGAIHNTGWDAIGDIKGDFVGNYIYNDDKDNGFAFGGAIYNGSAVTIENIEGDFIGNHSDALHDAAGGAIYNSYQDKIGNIKGNFIGNYTSTINFHSEGGAIGNFSGSTIGDITGDFIGNYSYNETHEVNGGAIENYGGSHIGNIAGDFIGNYAASGLGWANGGAIKNDGNGDNGPSTIESITGDFIGNYVSAHQIAAGGAIYNLDESTIGDITGDFIGNHTSSIENDSYGGAIFNNYKAIIGNINGNFYRNNVKSKIKAAGGAIYNENNSTIQNIKGDFIENYIMSDGETHGGAIYNYTGSNIGHIDGSFMRNYSEGLDESHGGAIDNYQSTIGNITGSFKDNYARGLKNVFGGAIYNYTNDDTKKSIIGNIKSNFIGNKAISKNEKAVGGAIYNHYGTIGNIEGHFYQNSAEGVTDGQGGAIANDGIIGYINGDFANNSATKSGGAIYNAGTIGINDDRGIYNSNFYDNNAGEHGGAIYTNADLNIIADGAESLFKGNYVNTPENKDFEAIYVDGAALTLNAKNKGTIQFDDKINGDKNYKINIKGDDTSRVVLNNTINKAIGSLTGTTLQIGVTNKAENISDVFKTSTLDVQSGFVDIADANFVDYEFEQLTSNKDGKYAFDIAFDGIEGKSDRFVVDNDSNGIITLSNLVVSTIDGFVENADDEKEYFIQIIKNKQENDNLKLALDNEIRHITEAEKGMSSKDILSKEFEISKKDTADDSIKIAGWRDSLAAWAELDTDDEKIFELKDNDKQLLTRDAELRGKNLKIQGTNNNRLDLNDKKLLNNIDNEQNIEIKDVVVLNADNIDNEGTITLDTVKLERSSKITNNKNLTIKGKTNINGTITSEKEGSLEFDNASTNITGKVDNQNIETKQDSTINLYNKKDFNQNSMKLKDSTLNLFDIGQSEIRFNTLAVDNGIINIDNVDVDLENRQMGKITAENYDEIKNSTVNVKDLKVLNDSKQLITPVEFTINNELAKGVYTDVTSAQAPIFNYLVSYDAASGNFIFKRDKVNPAVMSSPVAQLAGGYASMTQSLEYAFEHADTFSALPHNVRQAKLNANKYAINDITSALPNYANEYNSKALWFKPYTSFENIPMKNGSDVDTVLYGSYVGGDAEVVRLKNGWDTVSSAYIGYTGSSQAYEGIHTYQNGIIGGVTQTFYKDNFYTALTASIGASIGETSNQYGSEDFTMLMGGIASRTGYNFEFNDGKFIIQPTLLMAYTMINTFDYTNAAGVSINSDPSHILQVHPYVKFVQNTQNGWQPYLAAGFVYNVMGSTQITANDFSLPSLSIKPYAEYGLGIQKLWDDKYTGYLQAMARSGGRNGVALTAGFRIALGNDENIEKVHNDNNIKPVNNNIVKTEPKQANVVKKAENKVKVQKAKKSDNKVKTVKAEKQHPLLNKISAFFCGNQNAYSQPTGEKKIISQLTPVQRKAIISQAD